MKKELKAAFEEVEKMLGEEPIQDEIEERVEEEKEQTVVPDETRSAKAINKISRMAKRLFNRKAELNDEHKEMLADELNEVGDELWEDDNEQIVDVAEELQELQACDLYDDSKRTASKIASFAKKLIVLSEQDEIEEDEEIVQETNEQIEAEDEDMIEIQEDEQVQANEEYIDQIEEEKIACAEKLVKIAKKLMARKTELTASQKTKLQSSLMKLAKRIQAVGEDEFEMDKSDIIRDYNKSNRYTDKRLNMCVDFDALNGKGTSRNIKPTTQLKDITLDDLRKIMVSLKGI